MNNCKRIILKTVKTIQKNRKMRRHYTFKIKAQRLDSNKIKKMAKENNFSKE